MRNIAGLVAILILTVAAGVAETVSVVVAPTATDAERTAAAELAGHLGRTWPGDKFVVVPAAPKSGKAILLGTRDRLTQPESFEISARGEQGTVAGADPRGVLYGVYALLEKLGWGFYLSYEAAPPARRDPFSFAGWNLADHPLFTDRVIFDWHNFLSSASTWELDDWQRWILGAARMKYNTVMIHAYGNNPIFTFRHHGMTKPVGYLTTTRSGRDWGTEHVNDVRRIWGGDVFQAAVFGSPAALVPDADRVGAAQALAGKAFSFARSYGLHVIFALDVDTESANPQDIILTLPESARLHAGKWQLANPDTPEGYAYWKAQAAQLLATYPQIDRLVVWFRNNATPWRNLKAEEFPAEWKSAYAAALEKNPRLKTDREAPGMFAISHIAAAFEKALRGLGRNDVELGTGTWRHDHLQAADVFFEPHVKLYWLDYAIRFGDADMQSALRSIRRGRPMLPVVWAHHDDRTFVGRPYTPFPSFASLVDGTGTGFGIIHWTTRPLDIYFKSLGEQVWDSTRNRPLTETAHDMAARSFGEKAAQAGGEYLMKWVTEGRMFGRETSDRFIDQPLADAAAAIARCRERMAMLDRIDHAALGPESRERLLYYRDLEAFVAAFFESHRAFERAQEYYKHGDFDAARRELSGSHPEQVLESYREAAAHGRMTRGEQALLITMNLRWLPYIESLRQALGMRPAGFKFGPTQHEALAQSPGHNTFWFDAQHTLFKVWGEKEAGAPAFTAPAARKNELCATGVRVEKPLELTLAGIMGDKLAPGKYRLEVTLNLQSGSAAPAIEVRGVQAERIERRGQAMIVPVDVRPGQIQVVIRPQGGAVEACAVKIVPEASRP